MEPIITSPAFRNTLPKGVGLVATTLKATGRQVHVHQLVGGGRAAVVFPLPGDAQSDPVAALSEEERHTVRRMVGLPGESAAEDKGRKSPPKAAAISPNSEGCTHSSAGMPTQTASSTSLRCRL